jgi:hypothetical protein
MIGEDAPLSFDLFGAHPTAELVESVAARRSENDAANSYAILHQSAPDAADGVSCFDVHESRVIAARDRQDVGAQ